MLGFPIAVLAASEFEHDSITVAVLGILLASWEWQCLMRATRTTEVLGFSSQWDQWDLLVLPEMCCHATSLQ